ncbi:unnamed protein product [Sphenostylis stenocarpa]|uniref:Uncharacterized protein n=1 Tax=Sphenostylis stenocarpa TaxID=92480 RepID=A0AA86VTE8_9FABA|nr:unnamed protein product [Sphenostylis stenocarpa]
MAGMNLGRGTVKLKHMAIDSDAVPIRRTYRMIYILQLDSSRLIAAASIILSVKHAMKQA